MTEKTKAPKDVTSKFKDVNPYDRLYDTGGVIAKVRVRETSPTPAALSFEITGSWADPKTGKARLFDNAAPFIVDPIELVVRPDSPTDLAAAVEGMRLRMVEIVSIAAANHAAKEALTGAITKH